MGLLLIPINDRAPLARGQDDGNLRTGIYSKVSMVRAIPTLGSPVRDGCDLPCIGSSTDQTMQELFIKSQENWDRPVQDRTYWINFARLRRPSVTIFRLCFKNLTGTPKETKESTRSGKII
jgi:hypothetical protein